jgi:hypothetical protein
MNKYLLMSAAAALATSAAGSAQAGSVSVHYGTASGGSYCDGFRGVTTASYAVGQHVYTACGYSHNIEDVGLVMKGNKNIPKGKKGGNADLSDTTFAVFYGSYSEAILFDLQTPIAAGGKWDLWVGFSDSAFLGNDGVLLPNQFAKVPGKKANSTVTKLAASLKK